MKIFACAILLFVVSAAFAGGSSYTSPGERSVPVTNNTIYCLPVSGGTDALTYYNDQATFEAECPGLVTEDFSSTLVPANSVASDTGPLDYYCNNNLFALHTLVEGIAIWEWSGNDMVVLTPPFMGVTSVTVGPNTFTDHGLIEFTVPTTAFGCFIVMPNGYDTVDIEITGAGGTIGTTSAYGDGGDGLFWGVSSDSDLIEAIYFFDPNDNGELFANVQFGVPTSLSRTTWGSVKALFE